MHKLRQLVSTVFLVATFLVQCALAQTNLTQIRDTIYNADGTPFNGTIVITFNGNSSTLSGTVSPLSTSARIYNGALSVLLVPSTTAGSNSYYQVVYSSSNGTTQWTETWQVPPSSNALSVAGVRTSTSSGSSSSSGTTSNGGGSGTTQYATLPIALSQVTGLTGALNTLASSVTTNANAISALQSTVNGLQTSSATLNSTISGLQGSLSTLTNTVNGLSSSSNGASFSFVDAEIPGGSVNGVNASFALTAAPSPALSLALYRNGLLQKPGIDFNLSGTSITFTSASIPKATDTLEAYYRISGSGPQPSFADGETPGGTVNGTNTAFTLAAAPSPAKSLELFKNGILLAQGSDYTLSGSSITFSSPAIPQSGDTLTASYRH